MEACSSGKPENPSTSLVQQTPHRCSCEPYTTQPWHSTQYTVLHVLYLAEYGTSHIIASRNRISLSPHTHTCISSSYPDATRKIYQLSLNHAHAVIQVAFHLPESHVSLSTSSWNNVWERRNAHQSIGIWLSKHLHFYHLLSAWTPFQVWTTEIPSLHIVISLQPRVPPWHLGGI